MPKQYQLDSKIEALNLLDRHDGDLPLVSNLMQIPVKTLRRWRAEEAELRLQFDNRQYRHFANIKLELLNDMFETCRDLMKNIKADNLQQTSVSQRAYTLTTLFNHATQLEDLFEDLEPNPQNEGHNRIRFVQDDNLPRATPRPETSPKRPRPLQSTGLRQALGQIGIGADRHPDRRSSPAQALLVDRANLPNGQSNLARSKKQRQTPKRRRNRRGRTPH